MIDLSIIVPVYNTAINRLEECFQSITSFMDVNDDLNIECLIIDDGSTKLVSDWCCNFSKEFPNFRFYKKENEGVSIARNLGIESSRGRYILFVDSDDVLIPTLRISDYISEDKHDLIFSDLTLDVEEKKIWEAFEGNSREVDIETVIKKLICDGTLNGPVCKIIRKNYLDKHHIYFDKRMMTGEDLVFLIQILLSKPNMYYISQCTYIYNLDVGTSNSRLKNNADFFIENNTTMYESMLRLINKHAQIENQLGFRKSATERYIKQLFNTSADLLEMDLLTQNLKDKIISLLSKLDFEIVNAIKEQKLSKANLQLTVLVKKRWFLLALISRMRIFHLKLKNKN